MYLIGITAFAGRANLLETFVVTDFWAVFAFIEVDRLHNGEDFRVRRGSFFWWFFRWRSLHWQDCLIVNFVVVHNRVKGLAFAFQGFLLIKYKLKKILTAAIVYDCYLHDCERRLAVSAGLPFFFGRRRLQNLTLDTTFLVQVDLRQKYWRWTQI